jgi:hypothetical protein
MDNLDSAKQDALNYYLLGEELAFIWFAHLEFKAKHEWLRKNRNELEDMKYYKLRGLVFQKIYHLCKEVWRVRKEKYRCEKYANAHVWFFLVLQDLKESAVNHFSSLTETKRGNKTGKIKDFRPSGRDVCRSLQLGGNPFLNEEKCPHFHLLINTAIEFRARDSKKPETPLQMAYAEYIAAYTDYIKDQTRDTGWCDIYINDGKARLQDHRGGGNLILQSLP